MAFGMARTECWAGSSSLSRAAEDGLLSASTRLRVAATAKLRRLAWFAMGQAIFTEQPPTVARTTWAQSMNCRRIRAAATPSTSSIRLQAAREAATLSILYPSTHPATCLDRLLVVRTIGGWYSSFHHHRAVGRMDLSIHSREARTEDSRAG